MVFTIHTGEVSPGILTNRLEKRATGYRKSKRGRSCIPTSGRPRGSGHVRTFLGKPQPFTVVMQWADGHVGKCGVGAHGSQGRDAGAGAVRTPLPWSVPSVVGHPLFVS